VRPPEDVTSVVSPALVTFEKTSDTGVPPVVPSVTSIGTSFPGGVLVPMVGTNKKITSLIVPPETLAHIANRPPLFQPVLDVDTVTLPPPNSGGTVPRTNISSSVFLI